MKLEVSTLCDRGRDKQGEQKDMSNSERLSMKPPGATNIALPQSLCPQA